MKFKCPECGSTNIEFPCYVNPNTKTIGEWSELGSGWCYSCEKPINYWEEEPND